MKVMICTKDGMVISEKEILQHRVFMYGKSPASMQMANTLIWSGM